MKYFLFIFFGLYSNCIFCQDYIGVAYDDIDDFINALVGEGVEVVPDSYLDLSVNPPVQPGEEIAGIGYFNVSTPIPGSTLNSGLIMATGGVVNPIENGEGYEDNSLNYPDLYPSTVPDPDLLTQINEIGLQNCFTTPSLHNTVIVEFDFEPISDQISFEYIFTSSEFDDSSDIGFSCSQYNDIFGFFLSGPGINGPFENQAINIALVPDPNNPGQFTNTPVTASTITPPSATDNTGYCPNDLGNCEFIDPNWQDYQVFFNENTSNYLNDGFNGFNGFTDPFLATYPVIPCETYHIKLAIAHAYDDYLQSAVIFTEGSFSSPPVNQIEIESNVVNLFDSSSEFIDNLYEGCGSASVTFYRPEGFEGEVIFPFIPDGSATNLVDYEISGVQNNEIVMSAGEDSVILQVVPFGDQDLEPTEELTIEILPVSYDCYLTERDTIVFEIFDQPILEFESVSSDFLLDCPGDEANLNAQASGGIASLMVEPEYIYQWSEQPDPEQNVTVSPIIPTDYYISVTDVCGQVISDVVFVDFQLYEELILSSDTVYTCYNQLEEVCIETEGGNPPFSFLWENDSIGPCMEDFPGIYPVSVIDDCNLESTYSGLIYLDEAPDPAFSVYQMPDDNLGVDINNSTFALDGLNYLWDFGDNSGSIVEDPESHYYPESGEYTVTLGVTTEINNCYKELSQVVQVAPLYYYYSPNTFTPNGDMMNDTFSPSIVGIETYELFIFDRWGKQVFYSNDFNNKWDGTFESTDVQNGTYSFKVLVKKYYDDTIYQEYGMVTLIR
tara:strand:+ start:4372 stop:6717 length:2346 start_codon:yes stop_codon:yes gene_type:complete